MTFSQTVNLIETSIYVPMIAIGVALNFLVLKTACQQCRRRRHDQEKVNNYFIFNLAMADIVTLLVAIPHQLIELNVSVWPFGNIFCRFIYSITNSINYVSILSIAALSLHRNWLLIRPSWLSCLNTANAKCFIIVLWWTSYTVLGLPLIFVMKVVHREDNTSACDPVWTTKNGPKIHLTFMVALVVLPLLSTTCSYYRIRQVFRKFVTSDQGAAYVSRLPAKRFLVKLRTFARLLNTVVCGFWICYTPYIAMALFRAYSDQPIPENLDRILVCIGRVILYCNVLVNPFVLIIFSNPYRKSAFRFARFHRDNAGIQFRHQLKVTPSGQIE